MLLFVNGLPLGQVELKNPADEKATPESAANQVAHYVETIPPLYRFVEIIGVSDLIQARVGTITTPAEHFSEWKTMDPAESEGKSELEVMLRGAFSPERLLDLVQNFVLFEVDARQDDQGPRQVPPGGRRQPRGRGDGGGDGRRRPGRCRLAHPGRWQELLDGLLHAEAPS